jgi:hypothetical protein
MAAFTPLVLAAAAAAHPPYPVNEVLTAFGEVCFANPDPGTYSDEDVGLVFAAWKGAAEQQGWVQVQPIPFRARPASRTERLDQRVELAFDGIDSAFIASIAGSQGADVAVRGLYRKLVAGRTVYLSMMAASDGSTTLTECRLHDPIGDGFRTSPISEQALEQWSGADLKRQRSLYGGKVYAWRDSGDADRSVRVHFGLSGYPMPWGDKFRPYEMYGLTLVASDYSQIIVT